MTYPIHVIIPMSGQGARYQKAGYREPKPMIPINGKPMILRLLSNFLSSWKYYFVIAENHHDTGLEEVVRGWRNDDQSRVSFGRGLAAFVDLFRLSLRR